MAHEAFKRGHLKASKFRGVCEISREIYWSVLDEVVREKCITVRWKAVKVDRQLLDLKEFFEGSNPIGKKDRPEEELEVINRERLKIFESEDSEQQGMLSDAYKNHLINRDPNKTLHEVLRELYEVIEDSDHQTKVLEAEYMASRMILKISEYQKRMNA